MSNQKSKNKKSVYSGGLSKIKFVAILGGVLTCGTYLGVINATAVKGYEVKAIEQKISQLKKDNKQLQIQEAELNSFYNIKDNIGNLNMVPANEIVYIDSNDKAVAVRK